MSEIHSIDAEDDQFAYRYDTQLLIDRRDEDLDEDEMERFLRSANDSCPFYRPGDEYRTARRQ